MSDSVLVTGVGGYIGQHCAAELLRSGFRVRGSVRDAGRTEPIRAAIGRVAPVDRLDFVELDLRADANWDAAMAGCRYVLHVASPYAMVEARQASAIIEPALQGTKRALAAARDAGVERVVVTSSVVAMNGHMTRGTFGPDDWTDLEAPGINPYVRSKTLAERAAWDFARAHPDGPSVVAINPGATYGPTLTGDVGGQSLQWVAAMLRGKVPLLGRFSFTMVDVRDVARLQVRAMTTPEAAGRRYVAASREPVPFVRIAEILRANGFDKVSTRTVPDFVVRVMGRFDRDVRGLVDFLGKDVGSDPSATIRDLEWSPTPFETTILDMAESLRTVVEV